MGTCAAWATARALMALAAVVMLVALAAAPASSEPSAKAKGKKLREMIFVGNNWAGTADVVRPKGKYRRIARINVVPDLEERMVEIATDPVRLGYFLGIRTLVGEGNDQFVDDMYTSKDGRLLIVSRPSLADVVAIRLRTGRSSGGSPWRASEPITWAFRPTASTSPSRTTPRTWSTS